MLRRSIAYFLILTTLTANCTRFFVFAGFKLNQKYITENLCINKSRPWMHCNGKCYFMKKIRQAEENDKKQEAKENLSRSDVSFFQEPFRLSFIEPKLLDTFKSSFPPYRYQCDNRYLESIFRPPKQAV